MRLAFTRIFTEKARTIAAGQHGSTFGSNPLTCAAAGAAIDFMLTNDIAKQAAEKGSCFSEKFSQIKNEKIREVRQIGLMIGIELKEKAQIHIERLQDEGVLAMVAGPTVLRLLPPLTITYPELDIVLDKLKQIVN